MNTTLENIEKANTDSTTFNLLFIGDVVAKAGRAALRRELKELKKKFNANLVVVNGENSCGGLGIDIKSAQDLFNYGADIVTLGDHAYHKKGYRDVFNRFENKVIRPANFLKGVPGTGWSKFDLPHTDFSGNKCIVKVGIVNLMGRVFMNEQLDCPYQTMRCLLDGSLLDCNLIAVDLHAEATAEKIAFARYFDGFVSVIVGTHTHVQTNDNKVLPFGTGYITDLGMCGSVDSVIGLETDRAIRRLVTKNACQL